MAEKASEIILMCIIHVHVFYYFSHWRINPKGIRDGDFAKPELQEVQ